MGERDLRKLQLIAQIYQKPAGELIRTAVGRYIKAVARTRDFRMNAPRMLKRNEEMLDEFLSAAGAKRE